METNTQFKELLDTIKDLTETVNYVGIIAHDFQPQSQEVLNRKINNMVKGLTKLNELKDNFENVMVPMEVLNYIDQGKNPQLYTQVLGITFRFQFRFRYLSVSVSLPLIKS